MKAVTEDQTTDGSEELIVLLFDNDEERIRVGNQILNGFELKEGKRAWVIYPEGKMSSEYVTGFVKPLLKS